MIILFCFSGGYSTPSQHGHYAPTPPYNASSYSTRGAAPAAPAPPSSSATHASGKNVTGSLLLVQCLIVLLIWQVVFHT